MSTPEEKLERRFRAWWCARGYKQLIGRPDPDDYDEAYADVKYGWMAAMKMKEQG